MMNAATSTPDVPVLSGALLVVISAPSGAGKTTLCQQLLTGDPHLCRAVTCTTRAPRPGEREGVDYHFLDAPTFSRRVRAGDFFEHAQVHGHSYGTLRSELHERLAQGRDVLLNIDVQGAATVREKAAADPMLRRALVSVFLAPPSIAVLEARLRSRGQDAPAIIAQRVQAARLELAAWRHFDYLIVSRTIEQDHHRAQAILQAERLRVSRAALPEP